MPNLDGKSTLPCLNSHPLVVWGPGWAPASEDSQWILYQLSENSFLPVYHWHIYGGEEDMCVWGCPPGDSCHICLRGEWRSSWSHLQLSSGVCPHCHPPSCREGQGWTWLECDSENVVWCVLCPSNSLQVSHCWPPFMHGLSLKVNM